VAPTFRARAAAAVGESMAPAADASAALPTTAAATPTSRLTPLTHASVPDIVLASEMDATHVNNLRASFSAACEAAFGLAPSPALNLVSDLMYFGFTMGMGRQTLGEEVCDLLSSTLLANHSYRQAALAFLLALVPFARATLEGALTRKNAARFALVAGVLAKLHRACFFLLEDFADASRRALGSELFLTRPPAQPRPQYKALAVFIAIQLLVEGASGFKAWVTSLRKRDVIEDAEPDVVGSSLDDAEGAQAWMGGCGICLSPLTSPACPPCGHVYCYACIVESSVTKQECPTCRQKCTPQSVMCLR